jgi:hypothetical protein
MDTPLASPPSSPPTPGNGRQLEGIAFTFCKCAFVALLFQKYTLLAASGLAVLFYLLAVRAGVRQWRCWLKPPWVVLFWAAVFIGQIVQLFVLPVIGRR